MPLSFQITIEGVQGMNWRIEKKERFKVTGVVRYFKNDETDKIGEFWSEVCSSEQYRKLCDISTNGGPMGICGHINDTSDEFMYMIGVYVDDDTDTNEFHIIETPPTTWAVFQSETFDENPYGREIPELFKTAYKQWLPSSGYEKVDADKGEIYDMEKYCITPDGKFYEEIWLSVKKCIG